MEIGYLITLWILVLILAASYANDREKRYLLFPSSTQWGVFATVSIPLHPETYTSVAWFFEANYYNVANATYFNPLLGDIGDITISRDRDGRSADNSMDLLTRSHLYHFIESMLQKHGSPGRPCLLRAICENSRSHFLHNGLLGDLLHLVLTPSTSMSEEDLDDSFYEAEYLGLEDDCLKYQRKCLMNPMEYISTHINDII